MANKPARPKTTKKKSKRGATIGRPTKYDPKFARVAEAMCQLGATDAQVAEAMDIDRRTLYRWSNEHKPFCLALKAGKEVADNKVERALYERAVGYEHPEDKIFIAYGKPIVVETIKHHPPDVTAQIFWLKNRQPEKWRVAADGEGGTDGYAKLLAKFIESLPG